MNLYALVVVLIVVFLVFPAWWRLRREERHARALREKAHVEGLHEPPSIRPWIDPAKCMGSGACVKACPEDVLRVIDGQASIVLGSHCVGHGSCEVACPVDAIDLVFGSERRGIDLPHVGARFESNVRGLYIAGELGGMGLIANAVEQGVQAIKHLAKTLPRERNGDLLDVAIVGAGPAGLGAALAAKQAGLSMVWLDQEEFGGAMRHYPRQKLVMTRPMDLPGYGKVKLSTARKEELVALFEDVVSQAGLKLDESERVDLVELQGDRFEVCTARRVLHAHRAVLAIGRRGTPRRLGVPGEDQEKVAYRLIDAELYRHVHVLVVGGGDSAIEAAVSLSDQPGNRVTLSYRKATFGRPKPANRERLQEATEAGRITQLLESNVVRIDLDRVVMEQRGEEIVIPNDFVFVFAGGILPTNFLEFCGIKVQTHHGKRVVERTPASTR